MTKKVQIKVVLTEEEAKAFRKKLADKGYLSLTDLIRKMIKMEPKNDRPCAEYHAKKLSEKQSTPVE
jgi:hypothetical protein